MKNVRVVLAVIAASTVAAACSGGGGKGGGGQHGFILFGKSAGDFLTFEGSAAFTNQGFDLGLEVIEQLADDTCIDFNNDIVLSPDVVFLDAGATITISGPAGDLSLAPFSQEFFIYTAGGDASLFTRGAGYTVTVPGGEGVDAFTTNITATSDLTLNSPDPGAASVILDKSQPLTVAWTSTGGVDPIYVTLTQDNFSTEETIANVVCKFVDDGTASVPANFLTPLQASSNISLDTVINVAKRRFTTIETSVGDVVLSVETAWEVDLTVQ